MAAVAPKPTVDLEALAARASAGDKDALEAVLEGVRHRVYNLALRMLWHPFDAEDATQEILIRIVTHLGSFRGDSAFTTWTYRIAANYLLTTRKRRAEREHLTFERFAEQLDQGLAPATSDPADEVERRLLVEEMKIGCTHGMLLCLDRDHRLAYILGEILDLKSSEAAEIAGVRPATFRKRLSRARSRLHEFMERKCGLVSAAAACRCARRIDHAVSTGRIDQNRMLFATGQTEPPSDMKARDAVAEIERLQLAADVLRSHPQYAAPGEAVDVLRVLLDPTRLTVLAD
jgi:RNA polymerase sigma factor (sigma-70 family)